MNQLAGSLDSGISIRATPEDARRASAWMEQWCQDHRVPANVIGRLDICLNEALANVIAHGGPSALATPILLELEAQPDASQNQVSLSLQDAGQPFNPLLAAPPQRPQSLECAEPGGLGIVMMREAASSIAYQYLEGRNRVTFVMQWTTNPS